MRICILVTVATLALGRDSAAAQDASVMVQAIPVVTRADPTATRSALSEGYLSQPVVMAHASYGALRAVGTLDLEGLTLDRGELSTGGYGEGYVDRRHPHAYVHELLVGGQAARGGFDGSIFVGRGFAPFGSDDPMMRPFEKFPVNHHLAQVLERVVAVAALRRGPIVGEFATFDGDEPLMPSSSPNLRRFGDSWAARLTALPATGIEVSASIARVASPEVRVGQGLDQHKASGVARFSRETESSWRYALLEYARTVEYDKAESINTLSSMLGEAAYCRAGVIVAARVERTDRPEEEQLLDPFRTPRPANDLSNLGVSRWTILTGSVSAPRGHMGFVSGRPFVEVARLAVGAGTPAGIFNPELRYGASHMWMLSAGVRLRAGAAHTRMGRYGSADADMSMHGAGAEAGAGTVSPKPESDRMPEMPGMSREQTHSGGMSGHSRNSRCSI
ncbi:MAG: hypothetical protein ABJF01_00115 [bacterium]